MFESAFEVVVFHFVEAIHVELSDKAIDFLMPEVSGQDYLLKFDDILDNELKAIVGPVYYLLVLFDLNHKGTTPRISKVLKTKPATSGSSMILQAESRLS